MAHSVVQEFQKLAPAWRELEAQANVKLRAIDNERHYRAMVVFMSKLLDKVGDRETHPLIGLLEIVTLFVQDYEQRNVEIPDAPPAGALAALMEQNHLRQTDLAKLFGSQSNVSEVLSGKREINVRQARACEALRCLAGGIHLSQKHVGQRRMCQHCMH